MVAAKSASRRVLGFGVLLAVLGTVAGLLVWVTTTSAGGPPPPSRDTAPRPVTPPLGTFIPEPARALPTLTGPQIERAKVLLRNDARAQALLGNREYIVTQVGPWVTGKRELVGVLMYVSLSQPATLEGDWPLINYDEAESTTPPYQETTMSSRVLGVKTLHVLVDLRRDRLVSIDVLQQNK